MSAAWATAAIQMTLEMAAGEEGTECCCQSNAKGRLGMGAKEEDNARWRSVRQRQEMREGQGTVASEQQKKAPRRELEKCASCSCAGGQSWALQTRE